MTNTGWSRREMLGGALLGGALAGSLASTKAASAPPAAPVKFASARDEWMTVMRVQGNADGSISPWWYTGFIYGVRANEAPKALVRFEGCEMYRFTPKPDGSFAQTGRTTTFFQDIDSGEVLDTWLNPYTGKTVKVQANLLGGAAKMIWSDAGQQPVWPDKPRPAPTPHRIFWTEYGDHVWMRHDRVYPPGVPQPIGESSSTLVARSDLASKASSIPALFSSSYIAPWPRWMQMTDNSGHVMWHADGIKLTAIEDLPKPYLDRVRREHPNQLDPPVG